LVPSRAPGAQVSTAARLTQLASSLYMYADDQTVIVNASVIDQTLP
jgi:hypothetical protein